MGKKDKMAWKYVRKNSLSNEVEPEDAVNQKWL